MLLCYDRTVSSQLGDHSGILAVLAISPTPEYGKHLTFRWIDALENSAIGVIREKNYLF